MTGIDSGSGQKFSSREERDDASDGTYFFDVQQNSA